MVNFGRVLTAMITPFKEDGSVNYQVAEELAAHLSDHGTDTIVVCGTTGESPSLNWDEEYQLFQVVQKAVAGKAMVIAGTGSNSTAEAIAATQKAAKLGIDGSLQVVPYYNRPPQAGLYEHFLAIAQSNPELPLMLYNVPSRTGQNLLPSTVARLAEIPNIVAIKEASGNFDQVSETRLLTPPEFAIYSGDDSFTIAMLAAGAIGVVSVASHLVGNQLQEMIKAFQAGETTLATEIHLRLFPLFKVLFCTANPIPLKAALELQGWEVGSPRPPLCTLPTELKSGLEDVLKNLFLL
ncbi:MAG: 4-hydroxy-tetrahydrodipicolinate synthase [Symploca sp. SIO2E9]|nr:4-hydroxy-tetrahydrodipicolinate synthase [Symploca sp. SIO2E9]